MSIAIKISNSLRVKHNTKYSTLETPKNDNMMNFYFYVSTIVEMISKDDLEETWYLFF